MARRARLVLAAAIVLGLVGAGLALRLHPTAAASTFVSSGSPQYKATQRFYKNFGEEPVEVLVKGNLQQLVLSSDIVRLLGLEGCLSGNVPASALADEGGSDGPCGQLSRAHTVKVVFGPGTFINEAANQIDEQLASQTAQAGEQAKQAESVVRQAALRRGLSAAEARALGRQASQITTARFQEGLATLALEYGLNSRPSLENHDFVTSLVFDSTKPAGTPKQRFAYLFPSPNAALVSVRMRAGLSESQRTHTIGLIRKAVAMPQWQLQHGESYVVTGEPVIVSDLTHSISDSIELLLVAVLLVMAATLGLIFTGRPRLLPLAVAVLAAALTFGALSLAGASLTMASIAVLPVLVGLAVDYAIQFQSRVREEDERGGSPEQRVRRAAALGAPTIATAGAASAAAMLVLALSPVPMIRGFGLLLVLGVVVAFACALTAGAAVLTLVARSEPERAPARPHRVRLRAQQRLGTGVAAAWRGAGELLRENPLTRADLARGAGGSRAPARSLSARRARAGRARVGARHADAGADGHHQARPAEPRLAGRARQARARERRGRRDRPDGQLQGADQAGHDRMDELLRERCARNASATARRRGAGTRGCVRPSRSPTCSPSRPPPRSRARAKAKPWRSRPSSRRRRSAGCWRRSRRTSPRT